MKKFVNVVLIVLTVMAMACIMTGCGKSNPQYDQIIDEIKKDNVRTLSFDKVNNTVSVDLLDSATLETEIPKGVKFQKVLKKLNKKSGHFAYKTTTAVDTVTYYMIDPVIVESNSENQETARKLNSMRQSGKSKKDIEQYIQDNNITENNVTIVNGNYTATIIEANENNLVKVTQESLAKYREVCEKYGLFNSIEN